MTAATFTAADCAEQAGTAIAENCIAGMRDLDDQTDRANLLAAALIGLSTLAHPEHAAAGFARALVTTFEDRNPERESQIDNEAMQDDLDRYFSGLMLHQKQIRYARNEDACPICGGDTVFLNVGSDHYETCPDCKKFLHFGENLHSGWRDETPEVWAQNTELLKGYTEFDSPPVPRLRDALDLDECPF